MKAMCCAHIFGAQQDFLKAAKSYAGWKLVYE